MSKKTNNSHSNMFKVEVLFIVLTVLILCLKLINNQYHFLQLNATMEKYNIQPYEKNNYFVKNETLKNMKYKIIDNTSDFIKWYDQNIHLSEVNSKTKNEIIKSKDKNKLEQLEKLYIKDIKEKNEVVKNDVLDILNKKLEYSNKELKTINDLKSKANNLKFNTLKEGIDVYYNLSDIKKEAQKNYDNSKNRIQKEKEQRQREEELKRQQEEQQQQNSSNEDKSDNDNSSASSLPKDGNYNRALAQELFNAINAYRTSLGLTPYTYNSSKQSCVDQESKAYANTQNPHNWVCDVANENASIAAIGSDAVSISMEFFVNDPPHEEVLSGNYTSCAVSIYESNGMYYMIVGVF